MDCPDPLALTVLLEHAPFGVLLREGDRLLWANRSLLELLGIAADELLGAARSADDRFAHLTGDAATFPIVDADGETRWLQRSRAETPKTPLCCEFFVDVTREVALDREISALDLRDRDTGVLNQRGILSALDRQIARTRRYGNPLSIARLAFLPKGAPDRTGLTPLIQEIRAQLRWVDEVGRLDETHILLVLPETAEARAAAVVEMLQRDRIAPLLPSTNWTISVSVTAWHKGDDHKLLLERVGWRPEDAEAP